MEKAYWLGDLPFCTGCAENSFEALTDDEFDRCRFEPGRGRCACCGECFEAADVSSCGVNEE